MVVDFDPVAIQLGPLALHWYGLMYLAGFGTGWWICWWRAPAFGWRREEISDLIFYVVVGVIVGGRLGYALFYDPVTYLNSPIQIFYLQRGGMSFHGGLVGVLVAMWLYGRKTGRTFFIVTDYIAPAVPPGLFFGRIGNFINGELWGAPSDVPWAMVFKKADALPRHPSMLYEALLEGLVLCLVLLFFARKPRPVRAVSGLFLLGYGAFRFAVEFVRVPDADLGYLLFGWVTMGQILSAPMIVLGAGLLGLALVDGKPAATAATPVAAGPAPTRAKPAGKKKRRRR
ncbi:MAG: prolipoprotein diacylglyceryl transferase [Pseudomonadota bacterium]